MLILEPETDENCDVTFCFLLQTRIISMKQWTGRTKIMNCQLLILFKFALNFLFYNLDWLTFGTPFSLPWA